MAGWLPASRSIRRPEAMTSGPKPAMPGLQNLENTVTIQRIGCGPRMSDAVIHGNTVYLAGHVAGAETKGKSVTEQTRDVLAQIDETLAEAGTDKTKILSATIYLSDIKTFAEMNA